MSEQSVVTLHIAGEDYTIRAHATPEHARACAAHVDNAVREIQRSASLVPREKAVILAALAITDELFQARAALDNVQGGVGERISRLTAEIESRLSAENLAAAQ